MPLSTHASRWLIAALLGPAVLLVIFWAPAMVFFTVVAVAALLAWNEFYGMCFAPQRSLLRLIGLFGVAMILIGSKAQAPALHAVSVVLAVSFGFLYFLLNYEKIPSIIDHVGRYVLGQVYIGLGMSFLIRLYDLPFGPRWIFFALLVSFLGDTCAFYAGRAFGRRPLYPAVSPKKTVEGLLGGMLGASLAAAVSALYLPVVWYEAALLGLWLGVWGAAGDLFESMLKRSVGVKDSGHILMGHGGLLDRIDALVFNVPLVFLFALLRAV